MSRIKVIMIIGPTASGKTALGVNLARQLGGEIISADSRQVYRGMDIGTGKDLAEYGKGKAAVAYHLIDVANPKSTFNLSKYLKQAKAAVEDICRRGKLPIIVGGTGLYAQALADNFALAESRPDFAKRNERESKTALELMEEIALLQPEFAKKINQSDRNNKRRLARYLEVIEQTGGIDQKRGNSPYDFLVLGLDWPDEVLKERILKRLDERLEEGLVEEVKNLHEEAGVSWKRLVSFGLEYRFVSWYLLEKMDYDQMREKLGTAIYRFAKRQKTWFRRWEKQGRKIHWVEGVAEAKKLIDNFFTQLS